MQIPTYYVLVPDDKTPTGIEYARRYFVRQTRPVAGVWSVESGAFQPGYHLNVIAEWSELEGKFKGHIYAQPIRTHVRAVAAYMTKAERAATKAQGFARQTGDLGNAADWLSQSGPHAPLIAGAQLQHELDPHYIPPSPTQTESEYETARRWLAVLYETVRKPAAATGQRGAKETNDK